MAVGISANSSVGIRKEESFASGGAVNTYQQVRNIDLTANKNYSIANRIMNTAQQVGAKIMNEGATLSVVFGVTPSNSEIWWECGLGQTSTPYYITRPLKSMVVHLDRDVNQIYTSGDMISTLEFSSDSGTNEGELTCTVGLECVGYQSSTALSPTYTSGDTPFLHTEGVFEFDDSVDTDIMSFNVSVNNNLITDLYANQKTRRDIPATKCDVTGSFTRLFQDTDEYNTFIQELPRKIEATYSRGSNQFKVTLASVKYTSTTAPLSDQSSHIVETFEFTAYTDDPANDQVIQIDIT